MVFDMVLSSNSRSAEIPGTKGVTRSAFFEVGVLDSVRADRRDLYIGVLPIRSCLSTPALPRLWRPPRIPTTHPPPHARLICTNGAGGNRPPNTPKGRGAREPRELLSLFLLAGIGFVLAVFLWCHGISSQTDMYTGVLNFEITSWV